MRRISAGAIASHHSLPNGRDKPRLYNAYFGFYHTATHYNKCATSRRTPKLDPKRGKLPVPQARFTARKGHFTRRQPHFTKKQPPSRGLFFILFLW